MKTNREQWKVCFTCKNQNIRETSHEWIDCFCKLDEHKQSPFYGCDRWNGLDKNDDI